MQAPFLQKHFPDIVISGFAVIAPGGLITENHPPPEGGVGVFRLGERNEVTHNLEPYIGTKGLRFHDRSSRLAMSAVRVLLDETGISSRRAPSEISVIVGSDGALNAQHETVVEALKCPRTMNPKSYPNRGCNVIAGQVSLMFGLRGESTVISSGYRSGIDALIYGIRKCLVGQGPYVVASGEALCHVRHLRAAHKSGSTVGVQRAEIEAGVACLVERVDDESPTLTQWKVLAYRQAQCKPSESLDEWFDDFLSSSGTSRGAITSHLMCIDGTCCIQEGGRVEYLPYDAYAATSLVALFEHLAKKSRGAASGNELVFAVSADRSGHASAVLLEGRKENSGSSLVGSNKNQTM